MAAPEGNRYAQKHSLDEWEEKFQEVYESSKKGKFLSLQEAWIESDIRPSTAKWLVKNYEVLAAIKKDINEAIISTINRGSLKEGMNPTASIWRMKQLGETDRQEVVQTNVNTEVTTEEQMQEVR